MQNKPQLSAEMEKRKHFGGKDWKVLPTEPISPELEERLLNECGLCDLQYPSDFEKVVHFLATALEEQKEDYRVRVLSEIYVMVEDNRIEETATNAGLWDDGMSGYNEAIEDILAQLRAKLEAMREAQ